MCCLKEKEASLSGYNAIRVHLISTFQPADHKSRNLAWALSSWGPRRRHYFYISAVCSNNITALERGFEFNSGDTQTNAFARLADNKYSQFLSRYVKTPPFIVAPLLE